MCPDIGWNFFFERGLARDGPQCTFTQLTSECDGERIRRVAGRPSPANQSTRADERSDQIECRRGPGLLRVEVRDVIVIALSDTRFTGLWAVQPEGTRSTDRGTSVPYVCHHGAAMVAEAPRNEVLYK